MASLSEVAAMGRAMELAQSPDAPLGPNPRVGCVLLDGTGTVLAEGYHRGAGHRHAEIDALENAGDRARGATAVVTLEPCNHTGRTGPCTDALIAAGVRRVVYAQSDGNPAARGGAEGLRAAGVDVEGGLLAAEARRINPVWTFSVDTGRPYVTWKFAATLDGRSAAADGTSQWITSPAARADVHRQRAECDAILVGTGTVLADDPRLTVRDTADRPLGRRFQPLRVVMGLRTVPAGAAVLDDTARTVHLDTRDPNQALKRLFAMDRHHVWLEGGPTLAGAFWRAGLVDRVIGYLAPALLGSGPAMLAEAGVGTIGAAIRLELTDVTRVGPDLRLTAVRKG
jgi:diaminohydroxyphosphoribosylaminopyrimidine deaminase / 5-amino-6-(5-phosphoribosylamino)uracil reductase